MRDEIAAELVHVYRFALRLTSGDRQLAEDIAHDAVVKALRTEHKCIEQRSFRAWILRITANSWRDWLRAKQRVRPTEVVDLSEQVDHRRSECSTIEMKETIDETLTVLDQLPERQRSVLYLVACEQLSLNEVAGVLQISTAAAKASLSVARATMRAKCAARESTEIVKQEEVNRL